MTLTPSTTYYFRVKAVNLSGESPYSNTISVTTLSSLDETLGITPSPASAPSILSITPSSNAIDLAVELPFINEYIKEIKLDLSVNADYSAPLYSNLTYTIGENTQYFIDDNNYSLTFRAGGLLPATLYYGRIRFSNSVGLSSYATFTTTTSAVLAAPEIFGTTFLTAIAARVNWGKVAGATTYFVDVATDSAFTALVVNNVNAGDVSFRDVIALVEATTYFYRIRASDGVVTSANSQVLNFTTLLNVQTYDPQNYNLTTPAFSSFFNLYSTSVELKWGQVFGAASYTLEIATVADFSAILQTITTTSNTSPVVGLVSGVTHYARVRAVSAFDTSNNSTTQIFTTLAINGALVAPQLLTPTLVTSISIVYQWVVRTYATRYFLEVSTVNNFASIAYSEFFGNVSSAVVETGLLPGTTYYARVRGLNSTEVSVASATVSTATTAVLPAIVVGTPTEISSDTFRLNWTTNVAYSGYRLSIWEPISGAFVGDGFFQGRFIDFVGSFLVDVFLKDNTQYSYMITGYTANGAFKNSGIQSVTTLKLPATIGLSGENVIWLGDIDTIEVGKDKDFKFLLPGYPRTVANTGTFLLPLAKDTNSYYVRGYSSNSEYSNTVTTAKTEPYLLPVDVAKTAAIIKLKKSQSTDYKIQVLLSGTPISGYTFPKSIGNSSSYVVESLASNTTYTVQLSYRKDNGTYSEQSVPTTFKTNRFVGESEPSTAVLTAPVISVVSTVYDRTTISLTGGYSTYLVNVARDSDFTLNKVYLETTGTSITVPFNPSSTYYIRAYGFNGTNRTLAASNVLTVSSPNYPASLAAVVGAPTITGVTIIDENQVEVTISAVTNAIGYKLELSLTNLFPILVSSARITAISTNKFLISGLSGSLQYYLRVYAYNSSSISAYSATQLIDTTP